MDPDRHFYLYAKGHYDKYRKVDEINGLRKIVGHRCGYDSDLVTFSDILSILLKLAYKHINRELDFTDFVERLLHGNGSMFVPAIGKTMKIDIQHNLIKACLGVLSMTKVSEIDFVLGEAKPEIFE